MKTLFVHVGGIGDFLLTCPALSQLARDAHVVLAGHQDRLELAVAAGLAHEAVSLESIDFSGLFSCKTDRFRRFASGFERAFVWMRDDDGAIEAGLRECGVRYVTCHPGLPQTDWRQHATAYYLEALGLKRAPSFSLSIPPNTDFQGWVIHPGSGSAKKNWPMTCFVRVAEWLRGAGQPVHWCVGPAEGGMSLPEGVTPLRSSSLVELARDLAHADGYVGNDSGISHLAAMVGCPTVAVFGPTNPAIWSPQGPRVHVVQGQPWPTVGTVVAAVRLCLPR